MAIGWTPRSNRAPPPHSVGEELAPRRPALQRRGPRGGAGGRASATRPMSCDARPARTRGSRRSSRRWPPASTAATSASASASVVHSGFSTARPAPAAIACSASARMRGAGGVPTTHDVGAGGQVVVAAGASRRLRRLASPRSRCARGDVGDRQPEHGSHARGRGRPLIQPAPANASVGGTAHSPASAATTGAKGSTSAGPTMTYEKPQRSRGVRCSVSTICVDGADRARTGSPRRGLGGHARTRRRAVAASAVAVVGDARRRRRGRSARVSSKRSPAAASRPSRPSRRPRRRVIDASGLGADRAGGAGAG